MICLKSRARYQVQTGHNQESGNMDATTIATIAVLMGLAAALYSTVGHGGASAY